MEFWGDFGGRCKDVWWESTFVHLGWRGGLVVGRRTCDLRVAGSRPGRDAAAQR